MPFAIELSTEIAFRTDLVLLANARGLVDAVEVGVDLGVFARDFLSRFKGHWYFGVDPYDYHDDFPHDRSGDMLTAALALAPYHGRCRLVRARSPECIPFVCSLISPQFVYIDGGHEEHEVYADLAAWWDVLPANGMLAGHDFDDKHPGVTRAVERFARERGVVVRLTRERDFPPSWYCYRTEPEKLMHCFFRAEVTPNPHAAKGA